MLDSFEKHEQAMKALELNDYFRQKSRDAFTEVSDMSEQPLSREQFINQAMEHQEALRKSNQQRKLK